MLLNGVIYLKGYHKYTLYTILLTVSVICVAAGLVSCTPKAQSPAANKPAPQTTPVPTITPTPTPTLTPTLTPTPTPEEESLLDFYPLKEGNMWEYEGEGMEYASFVQKVVFSSGNRYQVTVDNGGTVMANVLEVRKDSIVNTYRSGEVYNNENMLGKPSNMNIILLQTPIKKGNFWISEENHYEIMDTAAAVTVPAGEFKDCIAVRETFKDQTSNMVFYYKKGVGMVQSEFRTDMGDLITSKLKRYELK
ncbi:MAG: hypothetical protein APF77_14855 [Clostridia bacterium BRH_c25]|nr:MAG: hypothetical protein APF77_14855 [Clostridia bacterium BRH_c25]